MTDDPIQAAAERLAHELPLAGEPSPGVIALIVAAFREQRAEAEREWRDDKWDAVELQLNYTKQCLSDAEARVRALAAESSTHLTLTAEQWHRRWLDETNDSDKFEAERDKALIEIRDAREACPIVRRQDYFDATLLQAASQLFRVQSERDKWLKAFNDSEQFQNEPTKRAEAAEARCTRLEAALRQIEARDPDCDCDHTDEDCCAKHLDQINGAFCARCFAYAALGEKG